MLLDEIHFPCYLEVQFLGNMTQPIYYTVNFPKEQSHRCNYMGSRTKQANDRLVTRWLTTGLADQVPDQLTQRRTQRQLHRMK